jgi:hypothetical protein
MHKRATSKKSTFRRNPNYILIASFSDEIFGLTKERPPTTGAPFYILETTWVRGNDALDNTGGHFWYSA